MVLSVTKKKEVDHSIWIVRVSCSNQKCASVQYKQSCLDQLHWPEMEQYSEIKSLQIFKKTKQIMSNSSGEMNSSKIMDTKPKDLRGKVRIVHSKGT